MTDQDYYKIFAVREQDFEPLALEIFRFQSSQNPVYRTYIETLGLNRDSVQSLEQIPFLPIRFFKTHRILTTDFEPELYFESSGTTSTVNSRHYIRETGIYEKSFIGNFESNYGPLLDWCILGLLPSYLEKGNSSLVYMVNELIALSGHQQSGFYLDEFERLNKILTVLEVKKQKTLLIGVTFALLDSLSSICEVALP